MHNTSITKTEVALEFSSSVPAAPAGEEPMDKKRRLRITPDEVSEIRFYVPGSAKTAKKRAEKVEDGEKKENESEEEDEEDDEGETAAQVFHDSIKEKAEVGLAAGDILCTIPDILCLTPRGRFGEFTLLSIAFEKRLTDSVYLDIDMYSDSMRLRGKTYDYRITFNQCHKLYLLPKPDDVHCQFVVSLNTFFLVELKIDEFVFGF